MILAITQRYEKDDNKKYMKENFYLGKYFKDIFEELNILLFPVASATQLETVVNICDGLVVTGRAIDVNSFHHQAINKVAQNFKVVATSDDGIIEAIEYKNILGVQWHPEQMMDMEFFKKYIQVYF